MKTIDDIAQEIDIKIVHLTPSIIDELKMNINDCYDNSFICGDDEIYIGIYENPELELISFFHEIGHTLIDQDFMKKWEYNTLVIELECWSRGIEFARSHGVLFSDEAIEWGYKKGLSYVGHDERENSSYDKKKLWKYK